MGSAVDPSTPAQPCAVRHRHRGNSCFYLGPWPGDCAEEPSRQPLSGTSIHHSLLQAIFVV